jgi:hypothetical protein
MIRGPDLKTPNDSLLELWLAALSALSHERGALKPHFALPMLQHEQIMWVWVVYSASSRSVFTSLLPLSNNPLGL